MGSIREFVKAIVASIVAVTLCSCAGKDSITWEQEAKLSNGSVVILSRQSERYASGFPLERRGQITKEIIGYPPLAMHWDGQGARSIAMSFEIIAGEPYLAATPVKSKKFFCQGRGSGAPWLILYKWRKGIRQEVPLSDALLRRMTVNVNGIDHWGYDRSGDRKFVTWQEVFGETLQSPDHPARTLENLVSKNAAFHCD